MRRATIDDLEPSSTRKLISIHALLAESDLTSVVSSAGTIDFYPRSPCGERRGVSARLLALSWISIHALLAESDTIINCNSNFTQKFLSTLSLRRATARRASRQQPEGISIHALLAESDPPLASGGRIDCGNFYPRSPCGERLTIMLYDASALIFLSTLSLRRATSTSGILRFNPMISIHALLAESD